MRSLVLAMLLVGCGSPSAPVASSSAPVATTSAPVASSASIATAESSPPPPVSVAVVPAPKAPVLAEPTPPGVTPPPSAADKMDSFLKSVRPRLSACFKKSLDSNSSTSGNAKFTVSTDAQGKVTSVKVVCSPWPKPLTECIRSVYLSMQFDGGPNTFTAGGPC